MLRVTMETGTSITRAVWPKTQAGRCDVHLFAGAWVFALLVLLTASSGCARFAAGAKALSQLNPFAANKGTSTLTAYDLQLELMRFADAYSSMAGEVCDGLAAKAKTPTARVRPLALKVSQADAAISIACSPNPVVGIMDMVVLVSLTRASFEDYLVPQVYGEDAKGVVEKFKQAEDGAWKIAAEVLDKKQLDELKRAIDGWRAANPEQHYVSFVRLQHLYRPEAAWDTGSASPGSVFSLLFLDPFAGLDPAAREMEMSRHTAERAMYQVQRMPRILDWRLSLALSKTVSMPESQDLLTTVGRLGATADRIGATAEDLPRRIAEERAAIVKDMEANEPKLRALLAELRKTLEAAENAADSVNETVLAINRLAGGSDKRSAPGATNLPAARPFDVTEYGACATRIASAAQEMHALVDSVDQKMLPHSESVVDSVNAAGTKFVDHVFWRAVAFVLIVFAGAVVAALFYRVVAVRWLKTK